jgi:hypothetical protein
MESFNGRTTQQSDTEIKLKRRGKKLDSGAQNETMYEFRDGEAIESVR